MTTKSPLAPKRFPNFPRVNGVTIAAGSCGIRYQGRNDLMLVELAPGTAIAGVFTKSLTAAAPIHWCRQALKNARVRAIVGNSGNANAFTGRRGELAVAATVKTTSKIIGCRRNSVFISSTGVIGDPLEVEKLVKALPKLKNKLSENKNNKLLLYCTGGIRCEKASSYLIQNGFKDVNQLNGGIIEYTHQINNSNLESQFIGKNFVFDSRMNESVTDDIISYCHQCNSASSQHVNCSNQACHILFIQCKKCTEKFNNCCSEACSDFL